MTVKETAIRQQLDVLYREHHGWLSGFLCKRLGCSQHAADLAQDTFLRLLSRQRLPEPEQARGYLACTAKRLVIDLYRRRRIEAAYLEQLNQRPNIQVPSEETRALIIEALLELDQQLDTLPAKVRQAFLMNRLDGLGYREIAEHLGVSVSSVEKYIARALHACLLISLGIDS